MTQTPEIFYPQDLPKASATAVNPRPSQKFKWFEFCSWLRVRYGSVIKPLPVASYGQLKPVECATSSNLANVLFLLRTRPETVSPATLAEISVWAEENISSEAELSFLRRVIASLAGEAWLGYAVVHVDLPFHAYRDIPIHDLLSCLQGTAPVADIRRHTSPLTAVIPAYPALSFPYLYSVGVKLGVCQPVFEPPRGFFEGIYRTSLEASRIRRGQQTWRIASSRVPVHADVTMALTDRVARGRLLNRLSLPTSAQGLKDFKSVLQEVDDATLADTVALLAWKVVGQNSTARYLSQLPSAQLQDMRRSLLVGGDGLLRLADRLVLRRAKMFIERPLAKPASEDVPAVCTVHTTPTSIRRPAPQLPMLCSVMPPAFRCCVLNEVRRSARNRPVRVWR